MDKREMEFMIKQFNCIPDGTKQACIKIREYLQNGCVTQNGIKTITSAVTNDEFIAAVNILLAYAWQNKENDCVPETWYCDSDCSRVCNAICPGEFQLGNKDENGKTLAKKRCPYFADSYFI